MQGQLGAKLVTDLIRDAAQNRRSGLLRLTRGKTIKAIFFEGGEPKFAISNLSSEQLDHLLIKQSLVTVDQLDAAKTRAGKAPRLARELVEMKILSSEEVHHAVREQVMEIIFSVFEWTQGEYQFDERIRAAHDYTLDMSAADVILEGSRLIAKNQQLSETIAPPDGVLIRGNGNGQLDSGVLMPVESYILSRIDSPTTVGDVGMLSGIADADAQKAIVALVSAGFLKLVGDDRDVAADDAPAPDESADRLRDEVERKLSFFAHADFYDILGLGRGASVAEIKAAYYQLAKKFHPDRHRQPGFSELKPKLETLFAFVTQAYQTLSEPAQRSTYDDRLKKPAAAFHTQPLKPPPSMASEPKPASRPQPTPASPRPSDPPRPRVEQKVSAELPLAAAPLDQELLNGNGAGHASASEPAIVDTLKPAGNPSQVAEHYYNQGRARYERKEYHAAVHLLREAVKLDSGKSAYHFNLGIALLRNPKTRREADEHLQRSAELEPYNSQIRVKLGMIYKEVGLPKKAEAFFRAALQMDPENRIARKELGVSGAAVPSRVGVDDKGWKKDLGSFAKKMFKK